MSNDDKQGSCRRQSTLPELTGSTKSGGSNSMSTQYFTTSNPHEATFGYSRAVKRGPFIFVSGTTSISPTTGKLLHPNSAYHQARQIFDEIIRSLEALGGGKGDIVRVRMFVKRGEDTGDVGKALSEKLGETVRPAATMIVGVDFVNTQMLVEIEAEAVVL